MRLLHFVLLYVYAKYHVYSMFWLIIFYQNFNLSCTAVHWSSCCHTKNHQFHVALTLSSRPQITFSIFSQVMILITGAHKAFALYKAIEEGVNHMWTVSAFQQHPQTVFVCDEDATLELRVKTVKYFKGETKSPSYNTYFICNKLKSSSSTDYCSFFRDDARP